MELAHITPFSYLNLTADQRIHMALAHLWKREEYQKFYREVKGLLLLDNGLYEGSQIDEQVLLEIVEELLSSRPDLTDDLEVVAPDSLYDGPSTVERSMAFIQRLQQQLTVKQFNRLRIMLVPQGGSPEEWEDCLVDLIRSATDIVSKFQLTIALSKLSTPKSFSSVTSNTFVSLNRLEAYKILRKHWNGTVHLLGAGVPQEWRHYERDVQVRSCDTSLAAQLATRHLVDIEQVFPSIASAGIDTLLNFEQPENTSYRSLLQQNILSLNTVLLYRWF